MDNTADMQHLKHIFCVTTTIDRDNVCTRLAIIKQTWVINCSACRLTLILSDGTPTHIENTLATISPFTATILSLIYSTVGLKITYVQNYKIM